MKMVQVIERPTRYPVTLAQAKVHIRQSTTVSAEEDSLIDGMIEAATEYAEKLCGRPFIQRRLRLLFESFPDGDMIEPKIGKIQQIISIKYRDADGVLQTMPTADYRLLASENDAVILKGYGDTWPTVRSEFDAVQIDCIAGYDSEQSPADRDLVPPLIKNSILMLVADMYENREQYITGTIISEITRLPQALHFFRLEPWS